MAWETEGEYLSLVRSRDASLAGLAHQYSKYIGKLFTEDNPKEIEAHRTLLNVLWQEHQTPQKIINELSPAVLYEVINAIKRLFVLEQKIENTLNEKKQNKLIRLLISHHGNFLKDYKTNDQAIQYFIDFDDNSWAQYIQLFDLISAYPLRTEDDEKLATRMREIFWVMDDEEKKSVYRMRNNAVLVQVNEVANNNAVAASVNENPGDFHVNVESEQVDDVAHVNNNNNNNVNETNLNHHPHKKNSKNKNSKNNKKTSSGESSENQDETKQNPIIKRLLDLKPTKQSLESDKWPAFFQLLSDSLSKEMPYQNSRIESYELLMYPDNESAFKKLMLEAVEYAKSSELPDKLLILLILGKFNDRCHELKNAPIMFNMNAVKEVFESQDQRIWALRVKRFKLRDFFFDEMFPVEYMKRLNDNQRAQVRNDFEKATASFIGFNDKAVIISYCARKICPDNIFNTITLGSSSKTVPYYEAKNNANNFSSHDANPGERSPAWEKFITKVYCPFGKDKVSNKIVWESNLNDDQKIKKLEPLLEQFNKDYPTQNEKAQAQGKFLSFIGDVDDCRFAEGAEDYAFLFIKLMVPGKEKAIEESLSEAKKLRQDLLGIQSKFTAALASMK